MTKKLTYFIYFISICLFSQNESLNKYSDFTTFTLSLGKTPSSNPGFPDTNFYKSISLNFGKTNLDNDNEWVHRLKHPNTGISFELSDFGNPEYLGYSLSIIPFIEFGLFKKYTNRLSMLLGMGGSYFTYNYKDIPYAYNNFPENNSRGVSTKFTWAFKFSLSYDIIRKENATWKIGTGFFHQSNGHTNLPNNGYNSILVSLSRQSYYNEQTPTIIEDNFIKKVYKKNSQYYFDLRLGLGVNVLSETINKRNRVYTIAPSFGKILNKTFKIGVGFYYRYYENYYNYIVNEGELVVEDTPHFMDNPFKYATNYGVFITSELLLGHIGVEATLGYNIYKPFYETDWRLTEGFYWEVNNSDGSSENLYIYGEKDEYNKAKKAISTRFGLRYYLFSNEKAPINNYYIGANINANLGQADFTELSIGYIHCFEYKEK
ncbi:MAG: acyloxyacyl hydrolase [Flavobacteriaceae bacterium]